LPRGSYLKMLDRIGDVDGRAVEAGRFERAVEHLSGRTDEGATLQIFLIARLLAHEHQVRVGRTFAKHGLRRVLIEVAARAGTRLAREKHQRALWIIDARRAFAALAEERQISLRPLRHH
jgi:hypothetical protein